MLPAVLLFAIFCTVSIVITIYFSLLDWSGVGFHTMEFIGFENYVGVFFDDKLCGVLRNNVVLLILSCTIPIVFSYYLAVILSNKLVKFKIAYRTIFFYL